AWHAPYDKLSRETITFHQCIRSLMEELEAVDWYRQRADDCEDPQLKAILLHNMREEMEHACMEMEWLRRNNADFARQMKTYLFSEGDITEVEERTQAEGGHSHPGKIEREPRPD
ncbi:MAG TPA: hypothetical protein VL974_04785, partial [Magnetospirillum sp.]|nr:hypothetical protein [Magnetospirillum sp.]